MKRTLLAGLAAVTLVAGACGDGGTGTDAAGSDSATTVAAADSGVVPGATTATSLVGGSGSAAGSEGVQLLTRAADRAEQLTTARFTMVLSGSGAPELDGFEMRATGAFDQAARRMRMDLTAAGPGMAELGGQGMSLVVDGDVAYLLMPDAFGGAPGTWLRIPADGFDFESSLGVGDPTEMLRSLRDVGIDATVVGTDVLDGVDVTHVRARFRLAEGLKAFDSDASGMGATLGSLFGAGGGLGDLGDLAYDIDVWVDGDGVPRRMRMVMDMSSLGLGGGTFVMDMTISDVGQPVDIPLPDPASVVDAGSGSLPLFD